MLFGLYTPYEILVDNIVRKEGGDELCLSVESVGETPQDNRP